MDVEIIIAGSLAHKVSYQGFGFCKEKHITEWWTRIRVSEGKACPERRAAPSLSDQGIFNCFSCGEHLNDHVLSTAPEIHSHKRRAFGCYSLDGVSRFMKR